jgi:hypothetical protein
MATLRQDSNGVLKYENARLLLDWSTNVESRPQQLNEVISNER